MEISTKEAINILTEYFEENLDTKTMYRVLANCMIDIVRLNRFLDGDLSGDEYASFVMRARLNAAEVNRVVSGESEKEVHLIEINSEDK